MWRAYLPHAMSLLAEVEFQEEQAKYIDLIRTVGRCLYTDESYDEAATLFETILVVQKNEGSEASYPILCSIPDLAQTYEKQGRINEVKELELQQPLGGLL